MAKAVADVNTDKQGGYASDNGDSRSISIPSCGFAEADIDLAPKSLGFPTCKTAALVV
jgi:hypothetical protein